MPLCYGCVGYFSITVTKYLTSSQILGGCLAWLAVAQQSAQLLASVYLDRTSPQQEPAVHLGPQDRERETERGREQDSSKDLTQ